MPDAPLASAPPADLIDALRRELGPEGQAALVDDPDIIEAYRADRATAVPTGVPGALVRARSTADVQATLRVATRLGVAVVPRGLGTGLSGGAAAVDGGIVLSTEGIRGLSIDPAAMVAVVGAGVINAEVKKAAAEHGLWYPPDPSSFEMCSIGGNLATNAGGLCCVKYGVTTDYVLGLEVVLADGRMIRVGGPNIKDVAGYDLKRLFVGSEGTLGVITEATLRLRPAPPPTSTVVATFADLVAAGHAVSSIAARLRPAVLEMMDRRTIAAVEKMKPMGLDPDAAAVVMAQIDSTPEDAAAVASSCESAGATYVAHTDDPGEGEMLMAARRLAIPAVAQTGAVIIEDVTVPLSRVPDLLGAIERIATEHDTAIPVIGHAGDGNFHPLVTYDAADPESAGRARDAFGAVMETAIELGGTITGEHGVGALKSRHLPDQLGADVMDLNRAIKAAFDPQGILNPGKWI